MLDRASAGELPRKHHVQLRGDDGALRYEECFTRDGFDGPFTILYHLGRPHLQQPDVIGHGWTSPTIDDGRPLAKRHYLSGMVARTGGAPVDAFVPMLHNADLVCGVAFPDAPDPVYVANADGDTLIYIHGGGGTLIGAGPYFLSYSAAGPDQCLGQRRLRQGHQGHRQEAIDHCRRRDRSVRGVPGAVGPGRRL